MAFCLTDCGCNNSLFCTAALNWINSGWKAEVSGQCIQFGPPVLQATTSTYSLAEHNTKQVYNSVLSLLLWCYSHLLLSAGARSMAPAAIDRYPLHTPALSSKPADRRCCCRSMGQTDGRTDSRSLHRPCSAYYTGSVNNESVFRVDRLAII